MAALPGITRNYMVYPAVQVSPTPSRSWLSRDFSTFPLVPAKRSCTWFKFCLWINTLINVFALGLCFILIAAFPFLQKLQYPSVQRISVMI